MACIRYEFHRDVKIELYRDIGKVCMTMGYPVQLLYRYTNVL